MSFNFFDIDHLLMGFGTAFKNGLILSDTPLKKINFFSQWLSIVGSFWVMNWSLFPLFLLALWCYLAKTYAGSVYDSSFIESTCAFHKFYRERSDGEKYHIKVSHSLQLSDCESLHMFPSFSVGGFSDDAWARHSDL